MLKKEYIEKIRVISSNLKDPYSCLKASTGFMLAAFLAGYSPAPTPTRTETRTRFRLA